MGWWTSVVNGATSLRNGLSTITNGIGTGAKWIWNNASLQNATVTVFTYGFNTFFQSMEQIMALRKAVPTLVTNPQAREIVGGAAVVAYDALQVISINTAYNKFQNYFYEGPQEETSWLAPYTLFLTGLTLINIGVTAYTWRQGSQASVRVLVLDSLGPPAFNSNKKTSPPSLCTELDCNVKRKMKGWGREPIILISNDILTWGISFIPYVGPYIARPLKILFNGRYITRQVTPERCERHKAMMQESVLALGLGYEISCLLMDLLFEHTIGMPPFLYHRVLRHLLLLMHINVAAHMTIPLVQQKEATLWCDPLDVYEWVSRFVADVIFAGLIKRIPIDFKRPKDAPPLIPLSPSLRLITRVLNNDLEKEEKSLSELATQPTKLIGSTLNNNLKKEEKSISELAVQSKKPWKLPERLRKFEGLVNEPVKTLKPWVLPPMFWSAYYLINDPVIFKHWPALREGGISGVDFVSSYGKTNTVATLAWAPKSVASALYYRYGISKTITRTVLMLSQEKDFWDLAHALKAWFERHNIKLEVKLVTKPQLALLGEKTIEEPPKHIDSVPVLPAINLLTERRRSSKDEVLRPEDLLTTRKKSITVNSDSPDSFFTTRKRVVVNSVVNDTPTVENYLS